MGRLQDKSQIPTEDLREGSQEISKERAVVEEERGENNLGSEGDKKDRQELGGVDVAADLVTLPNIDEPGMEGVIVCGEADNNNCGVDVEVMDFERDDSNKKDCQRELCELDQNIMRAEPVVFEGRGGIRKGRWKRQERIGGEESSMVPQVLDLKEKRKALPQEEMEMITLMQTGTGKKHKSQAKENDIANTEVGVASREWPQFYK